MPVNCLLIHELLTQLQDAAGVLLPAGGQNALVDGEGGQRHQQTHNADDDAGYHGAFHADVAADIGHYQAHAGAHDDGGKAAVDVGEHIGGALDLGIQSLQLVKLGVLLLGVLGADLLDQKLLIIFIHGNYLFLLKNQIFFPDRIRNCFPSGKNI